MLAILLLFVTILVAMATSEFYRLSGARFQLTRIDPLSYVFYLQFFMASVGSFLIAANLVDNDWINYMSSQDNNRLLGWLIVQYGFLGCGLGIFVTRTFFGTQKLERYFFRALGKQNPSTDYHLLIWSCLLILWLGSAIHVYLAVGGFPILSAFSSSGDALAVIRSQTKLRFDGIAFVRDYGFVGISQILAYYAYSLKLQYEQRFVFRFLFLISVVIATLGLTLNLEKGPIVIFFFSLLVLRFFHNRASSVLFQIVIFLGLLTLLVGIYFLVLGTDRTVMELTEEILGRIFVAQVAGVFMTLSIFPSQYEFIGLTGIGLISDAFGGLQSSGSPRIVMEHFRPNEVSLGLLGYKSSFFVAEAYGNFGLLGVILSPFLVGALTAIYQTFFMKFKNLSLGVAGLIYVIFNLPYTSNLTAFYYNPGLWILLFVLMLLGNITLRPRPFDKLYFARA